MADLLDGRRLAAQLSCQRSCNSGWLMDSQRTFSSSFACFFEGVPGLLAPLSPAL